MNQTPPPSFFTTFDLPLQQLLVEAIARAYDGAREAYNTHPGHNELTFGLDVYELGVYELEEIAKTNTDRLRVSWQGQAFRLRAGPFELAYHKVGSSADADINTSFPNNNGAVTSMVNGASYIPGLEPDLSQAFRIILAHLGNPEDGLGAVYLCFPVGNDEAGRINEWGYTKEIYRRGGVSPSADNAEATELAPEEVVEELEVRPRKRDQESGA